VASPGLQRLARGASNGPQTAPEIAETSRR
jgi:hypothetical protein